MTAAFSLTQPSKGDPIGISWVQSTTFSEGAGLNPASAFIAPALQRPNLKVAVNTQARKLIPTKATSRTADICTVERLDKTSQATTKDELILSAGAIESAHLLLLAGIGHASAQSSNDTLDNFCLNGSFEAEFFHEWSTTRTGALGDGPANAFGWLRVPDNSSLFSNTTDPSAGPMSVHFELIFSDDYVSTVQMPPSEGHLFTVIVNLISSASRMWQHHPGSLDLLDKPIIDPNFLSAPIDVEVLREGIKAAQSFIWASSFENYIVAEFGDFAAAQTNEELEAFARANGDTVAHGAGTVPMGRAGCMGAGCGALNPDLTVKGTNGLHVVDASTFVSDTDTLFDRPHSDDCIHPFIISGHTHAAVYILAGRDANFIMSVKRRSLLLPALVHVIAQ